jgi:hypothetical protein
LLTDGDCSCRDTFPAREIGVHVIRTTDEFCVTTCRIAASREHRAHRSTCRNAFVAVRHVGNVAEFANRGF